MSTPKLIIVIHAEEEFDWDGGFYQSNREVTHSKELITTVKDIVSLGGKVTLAMDYAFVDSAEGKTVIDTFSSDEAKSIEFATHLHPWVTPPYESELDLVENKHSYPGNLTKELELAKLRELTELVERHSGVRPITYLAGRYGIGENTPGILNELGYDVDLSISSYCDFSHQEGPDFSTYDNQLFVKDRITYIPHTSSVLTIIPWLSQYLNKNPSLFTSIQHNSLIKFLSKFARVKKFRLSPEGFNFHQMKDVTTTQISVEQDVFVLSFHSPSTKMGLTPYTKTPDELKGFQESLTSYIKWFVEELEGECVLPKDMLHRIV
ncbi:hypothetical protein OAP63_04455 [Vibrio sp.]|nr:hypothetical protein [Vibrio sp.]